jgi:hypothetical protein
MYYDGEVLDAVDGEGEDIWILSDVQVGPVLMTCRIMGSYYTHIVQRTVFASHFFRMLARSSMIYRTGAVTTVVVGPARKNSCGSAVLQRTPCTALQQRTCVPTAWALH